MESLSDSNGLDNAYIRTMFPDNTSSTPVYSPLNTTSVPTDNNTVSTIDFEKYIAIIVPTVFGLICVLGLFGNSLVILVVLFDKHMRNTTNILILSLAVADLLFILFCVPFTAARYALPTWPFGNVWCKITHYAMHVCAYASVYTLVIMSLDRYVAVVHAIRSMTWRSEKNTWFAIAIIWLVILCGCIPIFLHYEVHEYSWGKNDTRSTCLNLRAYKIKSTARAFAGSFFFFGYLIPLGITVLMYGLMLKRLLYGVVPGGGNQSTESIRAKKRVTRMVIIVLLIFALCWLPIQIIMFWEAFGTFTKTQLNIALQISFNCLAYMNSCVNPILYAFLSENFRRSFRKLLCCSEGSLRRMEYERTNIRFTVTEKEQSTKGTVVSKTYTPV